MNLNELTYELKKARNGDLVPIISGVHLHSIYNPVIEAKSQINQYQNAIIENNSFLILGLGFAYHIDEIIKIAGDKKISIIVIEPNSQVINDFKRLKGLRSDIKILNPKNTSELFENIEFVKFLKTKPAIIKHENSYSLYHDFFQGILKYQAPQLIQDFSRLVHNIDVKQHLKMYQNQSFDDVIEKITTQTGVTNNFEFALLAIDSIRNKQVII
ncbi:MAG: hypothetical protein N4A33_09610 [Bacteriovoracaceae bacterium]|jgi:hypothetical protein|nr:hypothetical protein [Bacteriovoracaceae bacterium]